MPPESYFVGSAIFHYLGPAFAVLLFVRVEPLGVAWLRIVTAAVVFALWRRPWRKLRAVDASTRRVVLAMGAVLAVMRNRSASLSPATNAFEFGIPGIATTPSSVSTKLA